jgi:ribose transport system permease protein
MSIKSAAPGSRPTSARVLGIVGKYGTVFVLVAMVVTFSILRPSTFFTLRNFLNILDQGALTAIIAGGLTLVLVVGRFDMSIGYAASLAGVLVVGFQTNQSLPPILAVPIVLIVGILIGIVNGLIVTKLAVNALIATLGIGTVLVGVNYAYTGGIPIPLPAGSVFTELSIGAIGGIPKSVIYMVAVLAILWVLLNKTDLGQGWQAAGGNPEAARLSGIRVDRVTIAAFAVAGACAAIGGVLLAARTGSGQIAAGDGFLLDSFAAAYLGSAALKNGQFHILGTLIGVLTVATGFTGLAIMGAPTFYQFLFKGVLLVLAVALSSAARRYSRE